MMLHIAAIHHFDPLCRGRLRSWLKSLRLKNADLPAFIAVEWAHETFDQVRQQRLQFRALIRQQWPNTTSETLQTVMDSLGFEADTHQEIFPAAETLWLDQGRSVDEISMFARYAETRFRVYKSYVSMDTTELNEQTLAEMSRIAWSRLNPPIEGGTNRDSIFTKIILQNIRSTQLAWATAVVGANHASNERGYMRHLLEQHNVSCEVTVLKPQTDIK
jgi:hypothetical protein